ncbi:pentatricopeptide repeat-containing protein At5g44230 [Macadamia integrifolia]|uniref:pentatricopeptide repeat-containing protein At5g44230 n=1 Tax=Macadamia integrifolia TaxID=60698 RepID=UPI001C4F15E1|nr:pentatricopeptide repeat-containing protein At5g44230 [Macadamia integrifolia]
MVAIFSRHWNRTGLSLCSCGFHSQLQPQIFVPFSQRILERNFIESQVVSLLHGCKDVNQLRPVHAHIIRMGLDQCCFVLAKFIRILTKFNVPMDPYPRLLFDQVRRPNPFLWTALIRGYSLSGPFSEAVPLYNRMRKEGTTPVTFTFCALFKACSATLDFNSGRQLHCQTILIGGFESDLYVGNTLIDMYLKCGFLEYGRRMFDEMIDRDVISWTSLIVAYAKSGDMEVAEELFDGLPEKDMVVWTAMVTGYAQNARPKEALRLFERMWGAGVETDEVTLVGVISACAQLGAEKYARWIRNVAEHAGLDPRTNVVVGSALIDMYSKCGSVGEAYQVFEMMTERNVYSYTAMIGGFAMHGQADAAMRLFCEMVETETRPNRVTFIGALTACSHARLVEQGRQLFASMQEVYGITPSADHYACMVDLLGRAGHLEEAYELVKTMEIKPHGGVWGALLGACRIHGNPDIAEIAVSHLFDLEPNGIGNYVLLSNIYASAGRWDDVSRMRKLIRKKGMKKNPACSWVEANNGVIHEFFADDMTHPKSNEIKQALKELLERLKLAGYKPNLTSVVYDLSDNEKEQLLMRHSEKLALVFGLLTTSAGSSIRIVKNLRICEDCHSFMLSVSGITRREIVVRDNMRFHHFRDGLCSCSNFW